MQGVFTGFATIGVVIAVGALLAHLRIVDLTAQRILSQVAFFVGSPALVRQIAEGAPADVFISADAATMATALGLPEFAGAQPEVIATNRLVLATAPANPREISTVADISDDLIALCAPEVPCGALARVALEEAGRRALAREANATARKLLVRAVELEPTLERRFQAARAAWRMSEFPVVSPEMQEVLRLAREAGDAADDADRRRVEVGPLAVPLLDHGVDVVTLHAAGPYPRTPGSPRPRSADRPTGRG